MLTSDISLVIEGCIAARRARGFRGWTVGEIVERLMQTGSSWLVLHNVTAADDVLPRLKSALEIAVLQKFTIVLAGDVDPAVLLVVAGVVLPRPVFVTADAELLATDDADVQSALARLRGIPDISLIIGRTAVAMLDDGLCDAIIREVALETTFF